MCLTLMAYDVFAPEGPPNYIISAPTVYRLLSVFSHVSLMNETL